GRPGGVHHHGRSHAERRHEAGEGHLQGKARRKDVRRRGELRGESAGLRHRAAVLPGRLRPEHGEGGGRARGSRRLSRQEGGGVTELETAPPISDVLTVDEVARLVEQFSRKSGFERRCKIGETIFKGIFASRRVAWRGQGTTTNPSFREVARRLHGRVSKS